MFLLVKQCFDRKSFRYSLGGGLRLIHRISSAIKEEGGGCQVVNYVDWTGLLALRLCCISQPVEFSVMSGFVTLDRAGFIGAICTDLSLNDAADFAAQRSRQVPPQTLLRCIDIFVISDFPPAGF